MSDAKFARVVGLKELKAQFKLAPQAIQVAVSGATEDTLKRVRDEAKISVRKDTGNLAKHIDYEFRPKVAFGVVGIQKGTVVVNGRRMAATHYAHLVEFPFHHARGKRLIAGRPFLIPATERNRGFYAARVKSNVAEVERSLATRGSRFV